MQKQPHSRRLILRTQETADKYAKEIKKREGKTAVCHLCADTDNIVKEFNHWILMKNKFPYDRVFSKSDMLVTKRHVTQEQLTDEERHEYFDLKKNVLYLDYDAAMEQMPLQKSIPEHFHTHLVQYIRPDKDKL